MVLAVAIALWLRLDTAALSEHIASETARLTEAKLKSGESSLTLMHGMGLKMEGVSLEHPEIAMQAGHININVRLLPLLLGKIEISTLDVHDAHFRIGAGLLDQASLAGLAALPVNRIRLIRASLENAEGAPILQDARLDMRNIGPEREALWEFQGTLDQQSLNGHGTLNFHHGEIDSGFGKLKFENIPVTLLSPLAPDSLNRWFTDPANRVGGALTLDLKNRQSWSIFGEVRAGREDGGKILSLRGKLHHPDIDQYFWDDSFIHVDDKAVITTKGQCFQLECEASIAARQLALNTLTSLLPATSGFLRLLEGNSDINASLKWQPGGEWQATGNFLLQDGRYHYRQADSPLPEMFFDKASIAGNRDHWRAAASLSVARMYGKIAIEGSRKTTGEATLQLETDGIEKFPQSLLDMVIAATGVTPGFQASGKLAGSMRLNREASGNSSLQLNLDAGQALISHPQWLEKPAGIPARCQSRISWPDKAVFAPASIKLDQCRLGSSSIGKLAWRHQKQHYEVTAEDFDIDLNSLRESAVRLPEEFHDLKGRLSGSISGRWPDKDSNWIENTRGSLALDNFGTASWLGSGELRLADGAFSSPLLRASGIFGQVELQGHYKLASRRGAIDILAGELDWSTLPQLPESWKQISLAGEIRQGHLKLLGNSLQQIEGRYRLSQGELAVEELHAELADGQLYAPSFSLIPNAAGLSLSGNIRTENVRLQKLASLNQWLQAELDGKLHTNLKLQGQLPARSMDSWLRSNGDILIYNGSWLQGEPDSLPERLGIGKPAAGKPTRFSKLSFRFRVQENLVDLSRLKLQQGQHRYSGVGSINKSRHIHGVIKEIGAENIYSLDGAWPRLGWQQIQ